MATPEHNYRVTSLADLRHEDGFVPIRLALGVRSFGMSARTAAGAGEMLVPEHDEAGVGQEELYLVVSGHAAFTVDGEAVDAPAGTIVYVGDPAVTRAATATAPETTVVSLGGKPGEAYASTGWEIANEGVKLLQAGRYAEAKPIFVSILEQVDDPSYALYNLACAEALLGEPDAALGHLGEALSHGSGEMATWAREDSDFESLWPDPRFQELTAGDGAGKGGDGSQATAT